MPIQPFTAEQDKLTQIIDSINAQPFVQVSNAKGNLWTHIYSYSTDLNTVGKGGQFVFHCLNAAGNDVDGFAINPGIMDDTPGIEQGDMDLIPLVDGKHGSGVSIGGRWLGAPPSFQPTIPDEWELGSAFNRWSAVNLQTWTQHPQGKSLPAGATHWVRCGAGFIPVY